MRTLLSTSLALTALVTGPARGQVGFTVGPELAPVDCPIQATISNDTSEFVFGWYCDFKVFDSAGTSVPLVCDDGFFAIAPGNTQTFVWDTSGVSPDTYKVELTTTTPPASTTTLVKIDPVVDAALVSLGTSKIGTTRNLALCAPSAADHLYLVAASAGTTTGIPTCAGVFPLDPDGLLATSLSPSNPFFSNFAGTLDSEGFSKDPAISLPDEPGLVGLTFYTAFVTLDASGPCVVTTISDALPMSIE